MNSVMFLQLLATLFFLSIPASSQLTSLFYPGFENAGSNLTLSGNAEIQKNGILKLTNETSRLLGHAFCSSPFHFKNSSANSTVSSFSTSFAFVIVPEYPRLGGHGLAFTISPSKEFEALPSQYLGLMNNTDVGNFSNHIFAVEFDTVQDFEFEDINDNHVGVDLNSMTSNFSVSAAYFTDDSIKHDLNLKGGKAIQVWINYDASSNDLDVTLSPLSSKPKKPILSYKVDLSPIFEEFMYVGFSASTGLLASSHYILGWSFKINGQTQDLDFSSLPALPGPKKNHTALIFGVSVTAVILILCVLFVSILIIRKIKNADIIEPWELEVGPHRYSYKELKKATRRFRDKEVLGHGGFGKVYKGTLPDSQTQVAVKRISQESNQGLREFVSEIATIGRLRHRNLVQLFGWCRRKGDLLLVYDFMANGSLDRFIFDEPKMILTWEQRFRIIKDVASGLLYLHEGYEQVVIHRDLKASNVLLDSELNGRLGDFGLARLYEHGTNPSTTRVVGTLGYIAPEVPKTGKATPSSDVYGFGILLLEVVCGRRPIEQKALPEEMILLDWVWDKYLEGRLLDMVDPKLDGDFNEVEVEMVLKLGLMCSNNAPSARPTMRQTVRYLDSEIGIPEDLRGPDGVPGSRKSHGDGFDEFVHSLDTDSINRRTYSSAGNRDVDARFASFSTSFSLISGRD